MVWTGSALLLNLDVQVLDQSIDIDKVSRAV